MGTEGSDAIVLLSGGLDSATALAVALEEGLHCHAVTFRYGQRHHHEVEAAARVARSLGAAEHSIITVPLGELGGSSLTDRSVPVPPGRTDEEMEGKIPSTYVPARNTIFLAYGLALAEITQSDFIYIGINSVDYSGYPDCRPEYVDAFRRLASLATKRAVEGRPPRIMTPLLHLSKAKIILKGTELGVDYSVTLSCYDPDEQGRACGRCDSCVLRHRGFQEAGLPDPTIYQPGAEP